MKPYALMGLLALSLNVPAQETLEPAGRRAVAGNDVFAGEIGPHHRVLTWTTTERDAAGQVREVPHRVVEIASGMHYWDG